MTVEMIENSNKSNLLLSNSVVATSIVVGGILLPSDHVLGVEKVSVCARSHLSIISYLTHVPCYLVNHRGLEVDKDCSGNVLSRWGLGKEGVEGIVGDSQRVVGRHLAIRHDSCS